MESVRALRRPYRAFVDKYRDRINSDLPSFIRTKNALANNPNSTLAMTTVANVLLSQSWFKEGTLKRFKEITGRRTWSLDYLLSSKGKSAVRKVGLSHRFDEFLTQVQDTSLMEWLEERHRWAVDEAPDSLLKQVKGLGPKGRDNILRDVGYFDRAPIDFHMKNFLIRTGIFHSFADREADPRDYDDHHWALSRFCDKVLRGTYVRGKGYRIHMAKAPGVLDLAIWSHCSRSSEEEDICGSSPRCFDDQSLCPLYGTCLWSRNQ